MFKKFILCSLVVTCVSYSCLAMKRTDYESLHSEVPRIIQTIYSPKNKKRIAKACAVCGIAAACSCVCSFPIAATGLALGITASNPTTALLGVWLFTSGLCNASYTPLIVAVTCCDWGCGQAYKELYQECHR